MNNEAQLYSFIEKYLMNRGIEIIQNEVNFLKQLKIMDLLAKKYDSSIYYFIEVKKGEVLKEDYYNLKYIIENNNIGKITKCMLIGSCKNERLKELIQKNKRFEFIDLDEIQRQEFRNNNRHISHHKSCYNPYKKYYKKLFEYISDETLCNFSIIDEHIIRIEYKIAEDKFIYFEGVINLWSEILGDIFESTIDYYFSRPATNRIITHINIRDLRRELYREKYKYVFYRENIDDIWKKIRFDNIRFVFDELSNIISFKQLKIIKDKDGIFNVNDSNLILLAINYTQLLLCDKNAIGFFTYDKDKEYYKKLKELCNKTKKYNEFNFLEFTNLIIDNSLIEPIKKIEKKDDFHIKVILELDLKNGNKVKKSYKVKRVNGIENVDFYLFSNWDIILDFQERVNSYIHKSNEIMFNEDYIKNFKWKGIKKEINGLDSTRDIFKNIIYKYGGIEYFFERFNRSII